ncbi:hypothetical protein J6590_058845 [Homalodisca vitripennis]|nr:hypothetical protein J6590_058845 [Homalodisca vitripennis]
MFRKLYNKLPHKQQYKRGHPLKVALNKMALSRCYDTGHGFWVSFDRVQIRDDYYELLSGEFGLFPDVLKTSPTSIGNFFLYIRVSQSVRRGAPGRRDLVLGAPPLSTKESKRHHTTIQCGPVCARGFGVTTPSSPCRTLLTGPAGRLHKQNN